MFGGESKQNVIKAPIFVGQMSRSDLCHMKARCERCILIANH